MARVYIYRDETFRAFLMDQKETEMTFGEDMLEEYGTNVDPSLIERYKAAEKEWKAVQELIRRDARD